MSSETAKKLEKAQEELAEIQTARDAAAKRLQDLRGLAGLDHVTVEELARGQVPMVSAAAVALEELERRNRKQVLAVQSLQADLRQEQADAAAEAYLVALGEFMAQLDAFEEMVAELVRMRQELTKMNPFSLAPSLARLTASIAELRTHYDLARGERHSLFEEEPRVEMVMVDGENVPRAEWEARPRKQSRGEFLAAMLGRRALD